MGGLGNSDGGRGGGLKIRGFVGGLKGCYVTKYYYYYNTTEMRF